MLFIYRIIVLTLTQSFLIFASDIPDPSNVTKCKLPIFRCTRDGEIVDLIGTFHTCTKENLSSETLSLLEKVFSSPAYKLYTEMNLGEPSPISLDKRFPIKDKDSELVCDGLPKDFMGLFFSMLAKRTINDNSSVLEIEILQHVGVMEDVPSAAEKSTPLETLEDQVLAVTESGLISVTYNLYERDVKELEQVLDNVYDMRMSNFVSEPQNLFSALKLALNEKKDIYQALISFAFIRNKKWFEKICSETMERKVVVAGALHLYSPSPECPGLIEMFGNAGYKVECL